MTIDVRLLRIDSRLLHGQVATNWAKVTKVDRILVVSDTVACNRIRKTLLVQAAPPGIRVNVLPVA
ncbi:MAG: PTS sugar transporter subunit IIB, partial [Liquorilactobacillus satsumensis]